MINKDPIFNAPVDCSRNDIPRYIDPPLRAVTAVLQSWHIKREWLNEWALHDWHQAHFYLG